MLEDEYKAGTALYLAVFLTFLGYGGRYAGVEPLNNQFFVFAAWSFILFVDNLAYRFKGSSLLIFRTGEFLTLAAWSLALAGLLELLNLRLGGWAYLNQAATRSTRWTGRLLTWAAILPSLFVLAELLRQVRFFTGLRSRPFQAGARLGNIFLAAGAVSLALALAAPVRFWPLVLPAAFLLAEPLNLRLGLPSLLREWAGGLPEKTLRLAVSGCVCGPLWHCWNKAAGSGWEYSVPGPPAAGLPAAAWACYPLLGLAAYSVYSLASYLRAGKSWEEAVWTMPGTPPPQAARWTAAALLIITSYIALRAVDSRSVKMYLGWV